jgi:hypothetical protein
MLAKAVRFPVSSVIGLLAIVVSLLVAATPAAAVVYHWDAAPGTPGVQGGSGDWLDSTNWLAGGGGSNVSWPFFSSSSVDEALFGGSVGGTVSINGNASVHGITFDTAGYTIAGYLTLVPTPSPAVAPFIHTNQDATIQAAIYGNGFKKTGSGLLTLASTIDNNFNWNLTGTVEIAGGTVSISNLAHLGSANVLLNGGALRNTAAMDFSSPVVTVGASGGTLDTVAALTMSGDGRLEGAGVLTKTGVSSLFVTGANAGFTGSVNLQQGALVLGPTGGIGSGVLQFNGGRIGTTSAPDLGAGAAPLVLEPSAWTGSPAVATGKVTFNGNFNAPLTVTAGNTGEAVLPGTVTVGGSELNMDGAGRVTIGTKTTTTLSVNGGTLRGTSVNAATPSHAGTKYIASHVNANGGTLNLDGDLAIGGNIISAPTINKTGSGTAILNGTNTSTSAVAINGGRLAMYNTSAINNAPVSLSNGALQLGWTNQGLLATFYNTNVGVDAGIASPYVPTRLTDIAWSVANDANVALVTRSNLDGRAGFDFPNQLPGNIFAPLGFNQNENWAARFEGYLYVTASATYNFWSSSDDGSLLYLADNNALNGGEYNTPIILNGGAHGYPGGAPAGSVYLTPGYHKIISLMSQGTSNAGLTLEWDAGVAGNRQVISHNNLYLTKPEGGGVPADPLTALTYTNPIPVSGASGIDITQFAPAGVATFSGLITMADGAALDVSGPGRTADFTAGFSLLSTGNYSLGGSALVKAGTITAVNGLTKIGTGNLQYTGTLSIGAGGLSFTGGTITGGAATVTGGPISHLGGTPATIASASLNSTTGVFSVAENNQLTITSPVTTTLLDKQGLGRLTLNPSAANTISSVTVNAGDLELIGASPVGSAPITLAGGARLTAGAATALTANNLTTLGSSTVDISALAASGTQAMGTLTQGVGTMTVNGTPDRTLSFTGTSLPVGAVGFGGGASMNLGAINTSAKTVSSLTKSGAGTLSYSGAIDVTGDVEVNGGTLAGSTLNVGGALRHTGGTPATVSTANLSTSGVVSVVASNQLTITSALAGTIDKQGDGRLILSPSAASAPTSVTLSAGFTNLVGNNPIGSAPITLNAGATLVPGRASFTAGLQEAYWSSNALSTAANRPVGTNTEIVLGPRRGNSATVTTDPLTGWADNTGFVYTGQFYDNDGFFAFAENIDDRAAVWVDGQLRLYNGTYNVASTTGGTATSSVTEFNTYGGVQNFGMGPDGDGWHTIEIRFNNGGGGAGPVAGNGWTTTKGFGLRDATTGLDSFNGNDYVVPLDNGSGSLFRVVSAFSALPNLSGNALITNGDGTISLTDVAATSTVNFAGLTRNAGTLTVLGGNRTAAFTGTSFANAAVGFAGAGNVNLGPINPAARTVTSLTKSGTGNLDYTGTLIAGAVTTGGGTLDGDVLQLSGATPSITGTASATIQAASVTAGTNPLTINVQAGRLTISSPITAGLVTKTGTGTAELTAAANPFSGLKVQGGVAKVGLPGAMGTGDVILDGGTLQLGAGDTGLQVRFYNDGQPANDDPGRAIFADWAQLEAHLSGRTPALTTLSTAGGKTEMNWSNIGSGALFLAEGYNRDTNYASIFDGKIYVPAAGTYSFWTNSDDGSVLYIDEALVVNNSFFQGDTERTGTKALTAGWHDVRVAHYQGGGGSAFGFSSNLYGAKQKVPMLYLATEERPFEFVSNHPIFVTEDSTIDGSGVIGSPELGVVSISNGKTLTILDHSANSVKFDSLSLPSGGGTVGLAGNADVVFDGITASATAPTVLNSALTGSMLVKGGAVANNLSQLTINVAANTTFGVLTTGNVASPLGGAAVSVGVDGTFEFGSEVANPLPLVSAVTFGGNATIRHFGSIAGQLGDATHPVAMTTAGTLTLSNVGSGVFTLAGAIPANATSVSKVGTGEIVLSGAYSGGAMSVNAGKLTVVGANKFSGKEVTVKSGGTLDYGAYSDNPAVLTVNPRGLVTTGGTLTPASLQMKGGTIALASGAIPGKLVPPAGSFVFTGFGGKIVSTGTGAVPGQLQTGPGTNTFDIADGPMRVEFEVGAQIIGSSGLVKLNRGTLLLSGQNTFTGGISFSGLDAGTITVTSDAALGDAANVLTLSGGGFRGTLGSSGVVSLADGRVNLGNGVGTIDVGAYPGRTNRTLSIGGSLGTGQLVKTGYGSLTIRANASPTSTPSSTFIDQGEVILQGTSSGATSLGPIPNVTVDRGGRFTIASTENANLTGVVMAPGYTHPSASNIGGQYAGFEWHAPQLQINSNIGNNAATRFPTAPITGVLDINVANLGQNNALNNADGGTFNYLPKMADSSVIRLRSQYTYLNTRLDGDVFLRVGDGDARIVADNTGVGGILSGDGSMIRVGGSLLRVRSNLTYTGKTIITEGATYIGSDNTTAATAGVGKIVNSTDIRIMAGELRHEDYEGKIEKRFNDAAVITMYGGTLAYSSRNANELSSAIVPRVDLRGGATINNARNNTAQSVFNVTELIRSPGGTVNFTGNNLGSATAYESRTFITGTLANPNPLTATSTPNSMTPITPWALVNNTDWAISDPTTGVKAYTGYATTLTTGANVTLGGNTTATAGTSINSLRLTAGATLTLEGQLAIASGGMIVNTGALTVTGGQLVAGTGGNAELVMYTSQQVSMNSPVLATGLTKTGGGRLILSDTVTHNFNGGDLFSNSGPLEIRGNTSASANTAVSNGGSFDLRTDGTATVIDFGLNFHITNSATQDSRNIHIDRYTTSGSNVRHLAGTLTVDPYVRSAQIRSGNGFSLQFGSTSIGEQTFFNLDGGTSGNNPWQFAVMGGETVTLGDKAWLNLWNGDNDWGSLVGSGTAWTKGGNSRMNLIADAQSGYRATVDMFDGTIRLMAAAALGTNTGVNASRVNVEKDTLLHIGVPQTAVPTIVMAPFGAISGYIGSDPNVFGGGDNKITLPATDAVFFNNLTVAIPNASTRGTNRDWFGLADNGMVDGVPALRTVDPTTENFRGFAFNEHTYASNAVVDYVGSLASANGDLNLLMHGSRTLRPSSGTTTLTLDTPTGVVNVTGIGNLRLMANGNGNGIGGNWTELVRYGDPDESQNQNVIEFNNGAGVIGAGKTITVYDGIVRMYNNNGVFASGSTLNIGGGATYGFWDSTAAQTAAGASINFLKDDHGYGVMAVNAAHGLTTLTTALTAGTFNFQTGSAIYFDTDATIVPGNLLPNNVNYILKDDDIKIGTAPLPLGNGQRLMTARNHNGVLTGGLGVAIVPGSERVIMSAANGRRLGIWDTVTLAGTAEQTATVQIGDYDMVETYGGDDRTRALSNMDGQVEFQNMTLASTARMELIRGNLRLGRADNTATAAIVINGVIDNSVRPANSSPYLEIHAGRTGIPSHYATGTGKIILGLGEDIGLYVNEVEGPSASNPHLVNEMRVPIEILGTSETTTTNWGTRGNYTGLLRSVRGWDRGGNYAIGRFTKVQPKAGAVVALEIGDSNVLIADFELTNDPAGTRPAVTSNRGEFDRVMIGNVTTLDSTERWLQIGLFGQNPEAGDDSRFALVGTLSGNANVSINNEGFVRLDRYAPANTTVDTSFNLGGRTLELKGMGATEAWVNPGAGKISIANTYRHGAANAALDVRFGRMGAAPWGASLEIAYDSNQFRTTRFRTADVPAEAVQIVNNFQGTVAVNAGGAGVLSVARNPDQAAADALKGRVTSNVKLANNSALALRSENDEQLVVNNVTLSGHGTLINNTAGGSTNIWIERVGVAAGASSTSLTVSGNQSTRITGSGAVPAVAAGGLTALGQVTFDPGAASPTAVVQAPVTVGNRMLVQSGTVSMAHNSINTAAATAAISQPLTTLNERFYRPTTLGLSATGFTAAGGDPFIMFENAINLATAPNAYTSDLTGNLVYADAAALGTKMNGFGAGTSGEQVAGAWLGQITIGGAGGLPAGMYTFGTTSDDGSTLYLKPTGQATFGEADRVVDNRGPHGNEARLATKYLAEGTYDIAVGMFQGTGGGNIEARWAPGLWADWGNLTTLNPTGQFAAYNPNGIVEVAAGAQLVDVGSLVVNQLIIGDGAVVELSPSGSAAVHPTASLDVDLTPTASLVDSGIADLLSGSSGLATVVATGSGSGGGSVVTAVPEPGTWVLLLSAALAGLLAWRRRK